MNCAADYSYHLAKGQIPLAQLENLLDFSPEKSMDFFCQSITQYISKQSSNSYKIDKTSLVKKEVIVHSKQAIKIHQGHSGNLVILIFLDTPSKILEHARSYIIQFLTGVDHYFNYHISDQINDYTAGDFFMLPGTTGYVLHPLQNEIKLLRLEYQLELSPNEA